METAESTSESDPIHQDRIAVDVLAGELLQDTLMHPHDSLLNKKLQLPKGTDIKDDAAYPFNLQTQIKDIENDTESVLKWKLKYNEVCRKLQDQKRQLEKSYEELEQLKNQILNESTFCANLGAVLGYLAWKSSNCPQIVDVWLTEMQNKVAEFLGIVNISFVAFINTYGKIFPPVNNVENQFMIGILGIVQNISASPEGRQFLIANPNGKDFVQRIIKVLPEVPSMPETIFSKKLMLMILYNVSLNKTGLEYLLESRVGNALNNCLEEESVPDKVQLLCLRVLQSITYDLTDPKYVQDVISSVSLEKIEGVTLSGKSEISAVAKQVVKYLQISKGFLRTN